VAKFGDDRPSEATSEIRRRKEEINTSSKTCCPYYRKGGHKDLNYSGKTEWLAGSYSWQATIKSCRFDFWCRN